MILNAAESTREAADRIKSCAADAAELGRMLWGRFNRLINVLALAALSQAHSRSSGHTARLAATAAWLPDAAVTIHIVALRTAAQTKLHSIGTAAAQNIARCIGIGPTRRAPLQFKHTACWATEQAAAGCTGLEVGLLLQITIYIVLSPRTLVWGL